jgi:hypothetical protein
VRALALVLAAWPTSALAAACCLSSSAFGVGRLAVWESGAVLVGFSASPSPGRWDENERWVGNTAGTSDLELRPSLAGIVALGERVQLSARVPWVVNRRTADGHLDVGQGAGDSLLSSRFELLSIGQYAELPGVAVNLGLTLPSGRPMSATRSLLAADVTGRGAWVVLASVSLERAVQPWYVQLNLGTTVPLPMPSYAPGVTQRFGPTFEASLAGGVELREGLVLSLVARATLESNLLISEQPVANSAARDLGLGPTVSWRFHPHWTLTGGVDTGIFVRGLGDNRQGRVSLSTGLRYGFF